MVTALFSERNGNAVPPEELSVRSVGWTDDRAVSEKELAGAFKKLQAKNTASIA